MGAGAEKKEPAPEVRSEWVRHPQRLIQGQASNKRSIASHDLKFKLNRPNNSRQYSANERNLGTKLRRIRDFRQRSIRLGRIQIAKKGSYATIPC
jgi:hypothetical protein